MIWDIMTSGAYIAESSRNTWADGLIRRLLKTREAHNYGTIKERREVYTVQTDSGIR